MKRINPWNTFFGSMVPNWLMEQDLDEISFGAKVCYGRLVQFGGKGGVAFPRMQTLANEIGCSERQVRRLVKELSDLHLIHIVDRRAQNKPHQITFLEHPWMPPIEARKSPKVGKGGTKNPRTTLSGGHRTDSAGGPGQIRTVKEETQGRDSGGKGSLSAAGAADKVAPPDPPSSKPKEQEGSADSPTIVDGVPQAAKSGTKLSNLLQIVEETSAKTRKQKRANASKAIARAQAKQQKVDNLQGKVVPPSMRKQRQQIEKTYFDEMASRYPDLTFAKEWDGTERGICRTLIERYSGPLVEQAVHYLITEWDGINTRLFKGKGRVPGMKVLSACHASLVPEAQQFAKFAEVQKERAAWFAANPHSVHLPSDLKQRYNEAKKALEGLAA